MRIMMKGEKKNFNKRAFLDENETAETLENRIKDLEKLLL